MSPSRATFLALLLAMVAAWVPWLLWKRQASPVGLEPLFGEVQTAALQQERGLQLILEGRTDAGRGLAAAAAERLVRLARRCAIRPDCGDGRFAQALDAVGHGRDLVGPAADGEETRPLFERPAPAEASVLRGVDLRERIPLNRPVRAALTDWLTWNRPQLLDAYENYCFLREKIAPSYTAAGLPEALLFAIMATESGGKAHVYSSAGAVGPLQFMRQTGKRYGLIHVDGFDMRLDPVASARASAAYLNDQLDRLDDDLAKTLAAYNVGENRLRRLDARLGGVSFWEAAMQRELPRETRRYVPQVLAAAWIFLHPDDYGVRFPEFEGSTIRLIVEEEISLSELALCLGQQDNPNGFFRTLRNLNPRLDPAQRLDVGEPVELPSFLVSAYVDRCTGDAYPRHWARALHDARY